MQALLMKLLIVFGFKLLQEHIAGETDSNEIEERLINAHTKEEVAVIAKEEAIRAIDDIALTNIEIPDEIVTGLANAGNTDEVVKVLESEAGQRTIFDVLGEAVAAVGGLVASLFGRNTQPGE